MTFSKKTEYRIRRILELFTFTGGFLLAATSICNVICGQEMSNNLAEIVVGLTATLIAYKGLVEDLPRIGALVNKRRFWE